MILSSSPNPCFLKITLSKYAKFCFVVEIVVSSPIRRNVNSMSEQSNMWATSYHPKDCLWTLQKFKPSVIGPFLLLSVKFSRFWALQTATAVSFATLLESRNLSLLSPRKTYHLYGLHRALLHLKTLRHDSFLPPSFPIIT